MIEKFSKHNSLAAIYRYHTVFALMVQLGLVAVSYVASFVLRLELEGSGAPWGLVLKTLPLLVAIRLVTLALFGLHRGLWRYVSVVDLLQIIKAVTIGSLVFAGLEIAIFGLQEFPRSIFFLDWMACIFLLSGIRLFVRLVREQFLPMKKDDPSFQRLLIVGAGDAGAELCKQALSSPAWRLKPVAFVDDAPHKTGTSILGMPVAGRSRDIPRVVDEYGVNLVVIAIPSATPLEKRALVDVCQQCEVPFKILPAMPDLLEGTVSITQVRDVDPADLLGRPPARLDRSAIRNLIHNQKIVLVTGAAGSVGSELARQIAGLGPRLVVLVDRAENPLLFLETDLRAAFPDVPMIFQIADVTDHVEMAKLMSEYAPQVVFHAATHKHVSLMERTPGQAVKNNVAGTYVLAQCAQDADVETFVLVSTDKAVKPTSVMGATKRLAELLIQDMDELRKTRFVSVRFGNVLGSNASVVPIFKQQIAKGGPVTVTDPQAQRYFMSITEAAGLILQAGAVGTGGEIFVLDMGEPVKITHLAETLVTLSGLKPYEDIAITFVGLRPGEKLSEELHFDGENFAPTKYEKLLVLAPHDRSRSVLPEVERLLQILPQLEPEEVKQELKRLVLEYQPSPPSSEAARVLGIPE